MKRSAAEKAIEIAGGLTAVGNALRVSPQAVYRWRKERRVPVEHVLALERLVSGRVSRHDLRPDIYPREAA